MANEFPMIRDWFSRQRSVTCRSYSTLATVASYTTSISIQWKGGWGGPGDLTTLSQSVFWPRINALFKTTCFSSLRSLVWHFFFFFARSSSPFSAFVVNGSASRGKRVEMKQPKGSWTIPGRAGLSVWLQTLHCVTSSFISDFAVGLRGESAKILSLSLFFWATRPPLSLSIFEI